jgi:anti-anti-sigma factor
MDADLVLRARSDGSKLTVTLAGELDVSNAADLRSLLSSLDNGIRQVTLDLSSLEFIDSTGVGVVAEAHRNFGPEMRELVLHNPTGHVARVLELTGLTHVVQLTPTAGRREPVPQ